jgi:hypothetical protein
MAGVVERTPLTRDELHQHRRFAAGRTSDCLFVSQAGRASCAAERSTDVGASFTPPIGSEADVIANDDWV